AHAFAHEVQSYFGSGTQLQELYVTPSLLKDSDWDGLAHAARWARAHADVLRDCHWMGGAPDQLEIYGWAAWTPEKAIVTLRNPHEGANEFVIDARTHLELPDGVASTFNASFPFGSCDADLPLQWQADRPQTVTLAPFAVLTLEFEPVSSTS